MDLSLFSTSMLQGLGLYFFSCIFIWAGTFLSLNMVSLNFLAFLLLGLCFTPDLLCMATSSAARKLLTSIPTISTQISFTHTIKHAADMQYIVKTCLRGATIVPPQQASLTSPLCSLPFLFPSSLPHQHSREHT